MKKFMELFKSNEDMFNKEEKMKYNFELLTKEERKKLLAITDLKKLKFRKGKRTRCSPRKNDVFVIEILDNIFAYGVILNPKILNDSCMFFDGRAVLVLYDIATIGINFNEFLKREKNILVAPFVTLKTELNNGFIRIIGNYDEEIEIDYGFHIEKCDAKTNKPIKLEEYYTENGKRLKRKPMYSNTYGGITTNLGILEQIYTGLILNKEILVIDRKDYNYLLDEMMK